MFTLEVAEASGATFRMLDYWARNGVLVPAIPAKGPGSRRQYTEAQVRIAAVLVRLSALGMKRDALTRVARDLAGRELAGRVVIDEQGELWDVDSASFGFGWFVDFGAVGRPE